MEKTESGKTWKKSVWKRYCLEPGKQNHWDGMQGIAIVMVLKGTMQISSKQSGEPFDLGTHEVCLLPAISRYQVLALEETQLLVCIFHLEIFPLDKEMLNALNPFYKRERLGLGQVILKASELVVAFAFLMDEYLQKGFESEQLFDIKRQELFLLFFATHPKQELAPFFYPLIGEELPFKEFVISNHIKAKNVQQLAKMANYSTSGFIKKFTRYFNESPYQWMSRHKAKLILDEINSSPTSLKEIAFKFNFSTYQHFVEFCKMQFGVTPSQLR